MSNKQPPKVSLRNSSYARKCNIFSKKVDKIIAISNYVLESIPSNLRKKTFLINNAIRTNNLLFNKEKNSLKLKKKLGVNKKTKIVLFLANFHKRKQPFIFAVYAESQKPS